MNARQMQRWERTISQGMARFILVRGTLLLGVATSAGLGLLALRLGYVPGHPLFRDEIHLFRFILHLFQGDTHLLRFILHGTLSAIVTGMAWGSIVWIIMQKNYSRSLEAGGR